MASKKEITRLLKAKTIWSKWFFWNPEYTTRKDYRFKDLNCFDLRSWKNRTKIRNFENRKYRRDKFNLAPHKKVGINYIRSIW